ncbi:MAG TPA: hypothetical protein VL856_16750 [Acidimicrobiia bacterium]|jgi:hypothetical protein|nr:hypothetical protein [Acidimicrobiia bacterium]
MLDPLPSDFGTTRESLHALAEHVVAPARYHAEHHIGLVPAPGGFGTPTFGDGERVRVEGTELVYERPGASRRVPITTLADAAQFVGVPLGAPTEIYKPTTACLPDVMLHVDAESVRVFAAWLDFSAALLRELCDAYAAHSPSAIQLWPEHFDLGCTLGDEGAGTRGTYGAAPGDGTIAEPYLYVSPWDKDHRTGAFAMYPFGAAVTYAQLREELDARAAGREFFADGAALLLGAP